MSGTVLGGMLVAGLILAGPLVEPARWRSSFAGHNDFVQFYAARPRLAVEQIPSAYGGTESDGALIELPWPAAWKLSRAFYVYQQVHGRRVLVCPADERLHDERLTLRNMPLDLDDFLASEARHVVVHKDLLAEERRFAADGRGWAEVASRRTDRQRSELNAFAASMAEAMRAAWGPPSHEDEATLVWDLARARAR